MVELIKIYYSNLLLKKLKKMDSRDKNKFSVLSSRIIATEKDHRVGEKGYSKETISTRSQTFYASPREHVPNRVLWFKKSNTEYFFNDYFPVHRDFENRIDLLKVKNVAFNYVEVTPLYKDLLSNL